MKLFSQRFLAFLLLPSMLFYLSATAQISGGVQPPTSYKLVAVTVTGSKRFTTEEVAAASGLPIGTIAHEEDFKKAARQLGETGAFGDITYTYTYSASGTKLEFHVADAEKFLPARFATSSGSPTKNYSTSCTTAFPFSMENCPPTAVCPIKSRT